MSAIDTTHLIARFGNQDGSMNLVSFLDMVLVNKKFKKINMRFYAQSHFSKLSCVPSAKDKAGLKPTYGPTALVI